MKIKVTSGTRGLWYEHKIGRVYIVTDPTKYRSATGGFYVVPDGEIGILCSDFVIINEYPTLTREYFKTG